MGADAADIGLTIHPHPTLPETIAMAAREFEGTITDLDCRNEDSRRRAAVPASQEQDSRHLQTGFR